MRCAPYCTERHIGDFQLLLTKNHNTASLMDEPWEPSLALARNLFPNARVGV